ncbi:hypothetical protein [Acidimangrovimonas pyrenivorans]|uniref:Uncharacterized protein n=1 Tax=Acidimangrovimonas pyrenivorans TaxID=2030798 RepID=A0ABV7AFY2_9RHOB
MKDDLPPGTRALIQGFSAQGREAIERGVFGAHHRAGRLRDALLRAVGAIAIGICAAGLAIFATVILLNLVFHYAPT